MKLICCGLLAAALLLCLADAQQKPQTPYRPPTPQIQPVPQQRPTTIQRPNAPSNTSPPRQKPQIQTYSPPTHQKPATQQKPQINTKPYPPQSPPKQIPKKYPQATAKKFPLTEPVSTCDVSEQRKIQCGAPDISPSNCEDINCCFDGRMCYYGKSVTLQCTKDAQFVIVIARDATLPNMDLESITFLGGEQGCAPVGTTSEFAVYQFPVTACGTVMTEEPGVIIYENRLSSLFEVAIGPYGSITRDSQFELIVQCRYVGTSVEAVVVEVGLLPPPIPVAALGPLHVELRLGNGECATKGCVEEYAAYNSFYLASDYPIVKVLRDPVYVEVRLLDRTDPNLVLTLGRCWASLEPTPIASYPQWDLLIDGCPYRDDRYLTKLVDVDGSAGLQFPTHHRRFVFKMFTFVDTAVASDAGKGGPSNPQVTPLKEKIYIHCETTVCQPTSANNCEPRCFRKKRDVAAVEDQDNLETVTVVSSQELVIVNSH